MKAIEITKGANGYPKDLHRGYVGFESYEEAREFAGKYSGAVVELRIRGGHDLWESRGRAYGPFELTGETFGDNARLYHNSKDYLTDCREQIAEMCERYADFDEITELLEEIQHNKSRIKDMEEGEAALFDGDHFREIIKVKTMEYTEDVYQHAIGVEIEGYSDEADMECD